MVKLITLEFLKDYCYKKKGDIHDYHPSKAKPLIEKGIAIEVKKSKAKVEVAAPPLVETATASPVAATADVTRADAIPPPRRGRHK